MATREGPSAVARETEECKEDHSRRKGTARENQQRRAQTENSFMTGHFSCRADHGEPEAACGVRCDSKRPQESAQDRRRVWKSAHSGQKTCRSSGGERSKKIRAEKMPQETARSRLIKHEEEESHTSVMA